MVICLSPTRRLRRLYFVQSDIQTSCGPSFQRKLIPLEELTLILMLVISMILIATCQEVLLNVRSRNRHDLLALRTWVLLSYPVVFETCCK